MPFVFNSARQPLLGDQIVSNANDWYLATFDARIFNMSQQTLVNYRDLNDALRWYAWQLDRVVNDCLIYCQNDVTRLAKLAKYANDTKLCNAVKSKPDQTLAMILDP